MVIVLFGLVAMMSCKEPEGIGLDVLPAGEQMPTAWIDTFTIEARTVKYDSIPTSSITTAHLIGHFNDPIFGPVRSTLYTQLKLTSSNIDVGTSAEIDSVVLNMVYSGSYGSTDKLKGLMRFGVYELSEPLYEDSVYYSDTVSTYDSNPLAVVDFRPDLYTETEFFDGVDSITLPPSFRVRLTDDFGTRILNSGSLSSDEDFIQVFKGLVVRPEDQNLPSDHGSILYFQLLDDYSRVELYYHNSDGVQPPLHFLLARTNGKATYTHFEHDFPATIESAVADSTVAGAQTLYVQSMAGLRMKVKFPFLRKLNELGVVAINKAELVIPMDQDVITEHAYPSKLLVTGIDSADRAVNTIDVVEGPDYQGGFINETDGEYVINLARHLQSLINNPDEEDYGIYIVKGSNAVNGNRGVFNGPEHPDTTRQMKLRMTYTIIE